MRFVILGALEVYDDAQRLTLRGRQQRALLAVLLLNANQVVSTDRLVECLWGERPPAAARSLLQGRVAELRRTLRNGHDRKHQPLVTRPPGYCLEVQPGQLDVDQFERLVATAEQASPEQATALLDQALALWRGPVLDGVPVDAYQADVTRLEERRLVVRQLHDELLSGAGPEQPESNRVRLVPAQLPADVHAFTGRTDELNDLDQLLPDAVPGGAEGGATAISLVSGTAGVGKTALAVRWAHRVRQRFPDGQLYLNLRGYDPQQPMTAEEALARLLHALGMPEQDIPVDLDARAGAYRTLLDGRRILIVLDNASSVEQVRPLLPGTSSCLVVVTSRDSLAGLVARHGARRLELDLLPSRDAVDLLHTLIGQRVEGEPKAAAALAAQCARLPLALRVAAELAATRPASPLAELVADLADHQRRLDLLDAAGDPRTAVRGVFSWSYQHLPAGAARVFRWMSLHPGADLDAYAGAALTQISRDHAGQLLELLARAHLVQPTGTGRYGMHDLLCAYARDLTTAEDSSAQQREAMTRLFDYYVGTAAAAMDGLYPAEAHRRPSVSRPRTPAPVLTDPDTARRWLEAERSCLVAIAVSTASHGWPQHAVRLSSLLFSYLDRGHHGEALVIHSRAHDAARQAGDRPGQALALNGLGAVHWRLGRYQSASQYFELALGLFLQVGDRTGEARARANLGMVGERLGRYEQATQYHLGSLALFRAIGDWPGEARALNSLGGVEERLGRYETATEHYQQALLLSRQAGDRPGEADSLNNLGDVEVRLGRYGPAADHQQTALAWYRKLGDRTGQAWALSSLAEVHGHLGRLRPAVEHFEQALDLFRDTGVRDGEAWALNGLGEAAYTATHFTEALAHHTTALTTSVEISVRDQEARAHTGLARAHQTLGDLALAREHYEHALTLYAELGLAEADEIRAQLGSFIDSGAAGKDASRQSCP